MPRCCSTVNMLATVKDPEMDIAVDPIDGTRPLANGTWSALSTVALAPRGTHVRPRPVPLYG